MFDVLDVRVDDGCRSRVYGDPSLLTVGGVAVDVTAIDDEIVREDRWVGRQRVATWVERYPQQFARFQDSDGRPPLVPPSATDRDCRPVL